MAVNPPFANLTIVDGIQDSFQASANINQYSRVVYLSTGNIATAANTTDPAFGTAVQNISNGSYGVVRLDFPEQYGLANTLINVGDNVYTAANYVSATLVNNAFLGIAKTGARAPDANTANNPVPLVILRVVRPSI